MEKTRGGTRKVVISRGALDQKVASSGRKWAGKVARLMRDDEVSHRAASFSCGTQRAHRRRPEQVRGRLIAKGNFHALKAFLKIHRLQWSDCLALIFI